MYNQNYHCCLVRAHWQLIWHFIKPVLNATAEPTDRLNKSVCFLLHLSDCRMINTHWVKRKLKIVSGWAKGLPAAGPILPFLIKRWDNIFSFCSMYIFEILCKNLWTCLPSVVVGIFELTYFASTSVKIWLKNPRRYSRTRTV